MMKRDRNGHTVRWKAVFCCVFLQEFWLRVRRQSQGPVTEIWRRMATGDFCLEDIMCGNVSSLFCRY